MTAVETAEVDVCDDRAPDPFLKIITYNVKTMRRSGTHLAQASA